MSEFTERFDAFLQQHARARYSDGLRSLYPYSRAEDVQRESARSPAAKLLLRCGIGADRPNQAELGSIRKLSEGLSRTYDLLADEHSRQVLLEVLAYNVLGPSRVLVSRNNPDYDQAWVTVKQLEVSNRAGVISALDGCLYRYDLKPLGFPIVADFHPMTALPTFLLQQYRYERGGAVVQAEEGDVAIDGGACWGDTSLYLAHLVGPKGRVLACEFSSDNLPILNANLEANPDLASRIKVVQHPLWSKSGVELSFDPAGPGTAVGQKGPEHAVTLSVDDLVKQEGLPSLDFIKLDVEGAEPEVLRGAEDSLRKFRPKLAVALYHSLYDFVRIPEFLDGLGVGYKFYLDHFSVKWEETILFAKGPVS